ncbi:MFS transporter [Paecilomyces variotii No. 5]|uniref:MFS transporter n=1 Tax=Byssochlamys spectabilis (strain No. 5 / NBRC 109023) TaxID=1356009 RepID=V5FRU5_BYSSN|nr:MFS transporter [Paecilomyces variotii No. 5]
MKSALAQCLSVPRPGNLAEKPPRFLEWRSSKAFIIAVVTFAVFTDVFLYGVIIPVTPTALEQRVGLPPGERQRWTSILLALYGAALLAASPVFGYLADKFRSKQLPLIGGLVALGASTALLCVGTNIGLWIAGRIFQGISAAMVWTVGLALAADTVGVSGIGEAMGFMGMAFSAGTMVGPLIGGIVYQHGGYYAVFAVAFALIAVDIILRLVMIEKKDAQKWLDAPNLSLSTGGKTMQRRLSSEEICADAAVAASGPNNTIEAATNEPTSPPPKKKTRLPPALTLLKSSRMMVVLFGYLVVSILMTSFDSVLPLFVQATFGWKQTGQGLIFVPLLVPHVLDPIFGRIIDNYPKSGRYFAAGALLCSVPVYVLLRLVDHDSIRQKILLCALLVLIGAGFAASLCPLFAEVSYLIDAKERESPDIFDGSGAISQGYGLFNGAFAAGSLIGPVWAGLVRNDYGWGTMGWTLGLLAGVASIILFFLLGGWIGHRKKGQEDATPSHA